MRWVWLTSDDSWLYAAGGWSAATANPISPSLISLSFSNGTHYKQYKCNRNIHVHVHVHVRMYTYSTSKEIRILSKRDVRFWLLTRNMIKRE